MPISFKIDKARVNFGDIDVSVELSVHFMNLTLLKFVSSSCSKPRNRNPSIPKLMKLRLPFVSRPTLMTNYLTMLSFV